ncbi:ferulic acid esterase [Trematosphaeria pertusa]|uniref:Carboxylic ester hydrolase n=1 Tax=Trematosphaeria pertusa TaxID=390896 RepID=A0A6A6J0B8_9PLEO|nr:ferulic acid esterase [Trematosphaeria pertusa]KAF2254843.1 ferulic acid esterase [Trematosphaeria pertusa]
MRTHLPLLLSLLADLAVANSKSFESKCNDIARDMQTGYATINFVQYLPAGSTINHTAEGLNATCVSSSAPPMPVALCRVGLHVPTSSSSYVLIEAWLPEKWESRLLSTGNSATGGCIDYPQMAYGASFGFATVGTNNGHNGSSAGAFFHQPEVLKDFSWRALYTGAVIGKETTKKFYDCEDFKSYHIGCSTSGRQLFDGIVSGAPVINNDGLVSWYGYALETVLGANTSDSYLTPENWKLVHEEVQKQCDALDGAADGILEDTRRCKLDSKPLYCLTSNRPGCLSTPQVFAMEQIFSPFVYGNTYLHPGAAHGDETSFSEGIYSSIPITFLVEGFRFIFYNDLSWEPSRFTPLDALKVVQANPGDLHTFNPNLTAFRDRGGKILHWHEQSDALASVRNSDWYYDLVLNTTTSGNVASLDEFYRYFRISGTYHCGGGPGANFIGQSGLARKEKPEDNVLLAIVDWVEKGTAPEYVRGVKFVDDEPEKGVVFTRRHCKHPLTNIYNGRAGNGTDEDGWRCVEK